MKALNALLETGSVGQAAERVNLSQPAMSRALNRLQHALNDPLLVRSGRGMKLTPRAEELRIPVQAALAKLSAVFEPRIFDPALAEKKFRIMAPDFLSMILLPAVLSKVFAQAPRVQIDVESFSEKGINDLSNGEISLAFGVVEASPGLDNVASQVLFQDHLVCLMRKGHPLQKTGMTLQAYASYNHALFSIIGKGGSSIDEIMKAHGLSRNIVLRVSHFLTISAVMAPTDLLVTVPSRLVAHLSPDELVTMELPEELRTPPTSISQIWHHRFTQDPAHQWLRRMVKDSCA
jgi:DNA-binding transcriptional LysR family regulator